MRTIVPSAVDAVDPDDLLERIDVNKLMDRVDINRVLDRVDVNRVLGRADLDKMLRQVALDALLDRVDVNRLLDRVDVNRLLDRVDFEAVMNRVDVEAIASRAKVESLVGKSAAGMAYSTLDLLRRQVVGIDVVMLRMGDRMMRRDVRTVADAESASVTGQLAGPLSRLLAIAADVALLSVLFTFGLSVGTYLFNLFTGNSVNVELASGGPVWLAVFILWAFLYMLGTTEIAGRTPGKGLVGLRVLADNGEPLRARSDLVRTLMLPVSCIFLIGLLGIEFGRRRKAFHDVVAHSIVVYDWGDRPAEMPAPLTRWLGKRGLDEQTLPTPARPR
ncbi:MAG: RDD family protein [Frankiaceae bacterium]